MLWKLKLVLAVLLVSLSQVALASDLPSDACIEKSRISETGTYGITGSFVGSESDADAYDQIIDEIHQLPSEIRIQVRYQEQGRRFIESWTVATGSGPVCISCGLEDWSDLLKRARRGVSRAKATAQQFLDELAFEYPTCSGPN